MGLGCDPIIPIPWLAAFAVAFVVLCFWLYAQWQPLLAPRYWRILVAAKLVAGAVVFLLLINPYLRVRTPDPRDFSIAFLIDATGSMSSRDCDEERRIDFVKRRILGPDSSFAKNVLAKYRNARFQLFTGERLRTISTGQAFDTLPGNTDIDSALKRVAAETAGPELGAVVLVSDGVDNVGEALLTGSTPYQQGDIPVHCIGIGNPRPHPDLSISFGDLPKKVMKGRPFRVLAKVRRNTDDARTVVVELREDGRLLQEKNVEFESGKRDASCEFELSAFVTGLRTYRVGVEALPKERNTVNNVAYASIKVSPPDVFRMLYFSGALNWEFRFLRQLAEEQDRLDLDAIIRIGPDTWFTHGLEEKEEVEGLPKAAVLNTYDCLVFDASAFPLLNSEQAKALGSFVENRGGGLIFTGLAEEMPEALRAIMPMKPGTLKISRLGKAKIDLRPGGIFSPRIPGASRQLTGRIYVPAEAPFVALTKTDLKPAAKAAAFIKGTEYVTVAAHTYGAGRAIYLTATGSWKWVLRSDAGLDNHGLFWGRMISWVASSPKERLVIRPTSGSLSLDGQLNLRVDLLNPDFKPENKAQVTALLVEPEGAERRVLLHQSPRVDGRYEATYMPRKEGPYKLTVNAELPGGEKLEGATDYMVIDKSNEMQPSPMAERELQSLARVTGGKYWQWRDVDSIRDIPLSSRVRFREERREFRNSWFFLIAVVLFLLPDWILRRRVGLR